MKNSSKDKENIQINPVKRTPYEGPHSICAWQECKQRTFKKGDEIVVEKGDKWAYHFGCSAFVGIMVLKNIVYEFVDNEDKSV